MWRVEGSGGRWAEMTSGEGFRADERTLDAVRAQYGDSLPVTPTGPTYTSTGENDEVWLWLAVQNAVEGRAELVSGTAPKLPIPAPVKGAAY
jgi:hypothetical protein